MMFIHVCMYIYIYIICACVSVCSVYARSRRQAEALLNATGRVSRTVGLGLEEAGSLGKAFNEADREAFQTKRMMCLYTHISSTNAFTHMYIEI